MGSLSAIPFSRLVGAFACALWSFQSMLLRWQLRRLSVSCWLVECGQTRYRVFFFFFFSVTRTERGGVQCNAAESRNATSPSSSLCRCFICCSLACCVQASEEILCRISRLCLLPHLASFEGTKRCGPHDCGAQIRSGCGPAAMRVLVAGLVRARVQCLCANACLSASPFRGK